MSCPLTSNGATARRWRWLSVRTTALFLVVLMCSGALSAYSVLTHEEIVDLLWIDGIRPLLVKRHPGVSLRDNILQFYSDLSAPIETKKNHPRWRGVLTALYQLKSAAPLLTVATGPGR